MYHRLSEHFTQEELTFSQEATRRGIDNTPSSDILENLKTTATNLEIVRDILDNPMNISSGYRCIELNTAIGGARNSQHVDGKAVDFTCPDTGTPRQLVSILSKSGIDFDQLILEFDSWVHISFNPPNNRKMVLEIDHEGTRFFK